jgi:hypothetical protein
MAVTAAVSLPIGCACATPLDSIPPRHIIECKPSVSSLRSEWPGWMLMMTRDRCPRSLGHAPIGAARLGGAS